MKNLIWHSSEHPTCSPSKLHALRHTHVHSGVALVCMALAALLIVPYLSLIDTEFNVANDTLTVSLSLRRTRALGTQYSLANLKGVDVMKFTKDTVTNQPDDATVQSIVKAITANIRPTHIAVSTPLDSSADYPTGGTPSPRSAESFTQLWADTIHANGARVLWRGTWSGIEGIYNFPARVGTNRFPTGTVASAPTDGNTTWLGKTYAYIVSHPSYFADGDIWAPLPERTEGIFQDATSFLPYDGAGIQANYANFFMDLQKVSATAFSVIGKRVQTGWTAQNFSEVKSGWLPNSLFDAADIVVVDHYGIIHTAAEMENDLRAISTQRGKQVFLQEWGDYWNSGLDAASRKVYLQNMYGVFQKLANEGILAGFNYWGGWDNNAEGILTSTNGVYSINDRGATLAQFFGANPSTDPTAPTDPGTPPPAPTTDTTPPTIQNVTSLATSNTASLTWNTSEPATTRVEYGLTTNYGQTSPLDTALLLSHSVSLTNLQTGTTYHYRLHSADAAGNETVTQDAIFTTTNAPQTGSPGKKPIRNKPPKR
ncbi:MAG: fibronectin type III domain-containing protein [Candidatus Doudnabacteria bacterium]|nr:fibronectin type III domain-containing protein [Candidatus Doudnabacteria bacterium]